MKRLSIFIISTLHCLCSNSQTLKTFSGKINDGHLNQSGNVTYSYYEDPNTHDYIKQGQFKYVFIGEGETNRGYNETITGNFNKGLKTGLWKYEIINADWPFNDKFCTGKTILYANYLNGYANGNWREVINMRDRKLYMSYGKYVWGQFENIFYDTIEANFKNGYLIGKLHINDNLANNQFDGSFDNNSFFTGNWTINDYNWEQRISLNFKNGFDYYYIKRGNDMHISYGPETNADKYNKLLNALNMSSDERVNAGYSIDTISWVGCKDCYDVYFQPYFAKLLNNDDFLYESIGGDLTYKIGMRGGYEIDLKEGKSKKELRVEDSIKAEKQRVADSIKAENKRIQDSIDAEKRVRDSINTDNKRIQDSINTEKQRIQDSIFKHEKDSAIAQNLKDNDTLDNLVRLHDLNFQTISNKFNITEAKSNNSNNSNDLLKIGSSLSALSSSGLNEKKMLIYQKYIRVVEYYNFLNRRMNNAHQKIPISKKQSLIDDNLTSLSSNRDIKDLAKKLDGALSDEAIETILITPPTKKD